MKKLLLCLFAIGLIASSQVFAGDGELFCYNKNAVNTEFAELNAIEDFVLQNNGITLSEMKASNSDFTNSLPTFSFISTSVIYGGPIGIPSFVWGCILGPVGILAVYLLADDPSSEARKALWGCILGTLLWGGGIGIGSWSGR